MKGLELVINLKQMDHEMKDTWLEDKLFPMTTNEVTTIAMNESGRMCGMMDHVADYVERSLVSLAISEI